MYMYIYIYIVDVDARTQVRNMCVAHRGTCASPEYWLWL